METGKTNNTEENKTPAPANENFDISSLLNKNSLTELLKHLLTAGGAMFGDYQIWIKPLQEKVEAMGKTVMEQDYRIKDLERDRRKQGDNSEDEYQKAERLKEGYIFKTKKKQLQVDGYEGSRNRYL